MKSTLRVLLLICILLAAHPVNAAEVVNRVVATVNGEIVTLFELNGHLRPFLDRFRGKELGPEEKAAIAKMRGDLLQKIVDEMLIAQEVTKLGLTATDVEVETAVDNFRKQNGLPPEEFEKQLKLEGLTREKFAENIRKDILKHRLLGFMVRRKVVVSDEEVKVYYDSHAQDFSRDKEVTLSVILLPLDQDADALRQRIEKGEISFADAANLYSQGPGVGQGGSLGRVAWPDLARDWRDALEGVSTGGMTKPFDFRGFNSILHVDDMQSGEQKPFAEVKEEIRDQLFGKQAEERFDEYMAKLRSEAVIEIKL